MEIHDRDMQEVGDKDAGPENESGCEFVGGGELGFVERCSGVRLRRVNVSAVMTKVVHSSHVRPRWPPHSLVPSQ